MTIDQTPEAEKSCSKCKVTWPVSMFAASKKASDGLHWCCRVCQRITTRMHRLGLSHEVASTPLPTDGLCEVCGHKPPNWGLQLDHDHTTGAFRGWLCKPCNGAMGIVGDNAERLRALADYLDRKSAKPE